MEPADGTCRNTFQTGVSIDQAAATLNVSPSTVRRWVKEGRLPAERVTTPQGHVFRAYSAALLAPLVAELAETRVRLLGQADRIAGQADEIGSLRAQLEQARSELRALKAPPEPQLAAQA